MANTQGIPDEALTAMLSSTTTTASPSLNVAPEKRQSAFKASRLSKRMEQFPMGDRPAATVVRASRRPASSQTKKNIATSSEQSASLQASDATSSPSAVLGSIVERDQQQQPQPQRRVMKPPHPLGSPSVHVPLGTFVSNNKHRYRGKEKNSQTEISSSTTSSAQTARTTATTSTLLDASRRDAQSMLAGLSTAEIQENVQELHAALSPETIAFLKQRGQRREQEPQQRTVGSKSELATKPSSSSSSSVPTQQQPSGTTSTEEKERMAQLLSSIQSYQELDAAYAATIQNNGIHKNKDALEQEEEEGDWDRACTLLRSTAPRQVLWAARVVCQRLEQDIVSGQEERRTLSSYPTLLPVALRCLLDESVAPSGFLLHSYVLRSLYALLRLLTDLDHVVDVTDRNNGIDASSIYQHYFLDDAIPTPPIDARYPSIVGKPLHLEGQDDGVAPAYATSSSSTSAQADAEAFWRDPMWTLLSRMRIIPRLAQLLSVLTSNKNKTLSLVPEEALVAICGILSMLAVRSPGAASAMAQHPQRLLPRLLHATTTLLPHDETDACGGYTNPTNAKLASLILLCTLARQSRVVATSLLPLIDDIVPPLLTITMTGDSSEKMQYNIQKWALVLWRTMLRYGLGHVHLATIVTLSIPHLVTLHDTRHSLATEYLSAFANACDCVKVSRGEVDHDERNVLPVSTAVTCLSSLVRQSVHQLSLLSEEEPSVLDDGHNEQLFSDLRCNTARIRLVTSFVANLTKSTSDGKEQREMHIPIIEPKLCWMAMRSILKCGLVELALRTSSPCFSIVDWADLPEEESSVSLEYEAIACAFLDALVSLWLVVSSQGYHAEHDNDDEEEGIRLLTTSLTTQCRALFVESMRQTTAVLVDAEKNQTSRVPRARRGWLNKAHFALCKFLINTHLSAGESELPTVMPSLRASVFTLLGRLEFGEEGMAAFLFGQDALFLSDSEVAKETSSSLLSSMFSREIYMNQQSRTQLDHSVKLRHGSDATSDGWGPFDVDTLLSNAESRGARESLRSSELLIPLGKMWLWNVLSGAVCLPQDDSRHGDTMEDESIHSKEPCDVISSCLELLLKLEEDEDSYARQIDNGAKLYHLFNICLYPEIIIRDGNIGLLTMCLFDKYTTELAESNPEQRGSLEYDFMKACFGHSRIDRGDKNLGKLSTNEKNDDEKLLSLLGDENAAGGSVSAKELLALKDFAADLCNAYTEFGAQYDCFTKCVRFLLRPGFPPKVRCDTIHRLRNVLHLLTLPAEEAEPSGPGMAALLKASLLGGLPDRDGSTRDAPQVLDMVASVLKERVGDGTVSRWNSSQGGYFFLFAVALTARSLAGSMVSSASGVHATKKRIEGLPIEILRQVVSSASLVLSSANGNKSDLVRAVLEVCFNRHVCKESLDTWDNVVASLNTKF